MKTYPTFSAEQAHRYTLGITVGNPFDLHGQTQVGIRGDGNFVVKSVHAVEQAKEARSHAPGDPLPTLREQSFEMKLPLEQARSLFEHAAQFDWAGKFPPRPGIPDEAIVEWTWKASDGAECKMKSWLRDAEKSPAQRKVLEAAGKLVRESSQNKIIL